MGAILAQVGALEFQDEGCWMRRNKIQHSLHQLWLWIHQMKTRRPVTFQPSPAWWWQTLQVDTCMWHHLGTKINGAWFKSFWCLRAFWDMLSWPSGATTNPRCYNCSAMWSMQGDQWVWWHTKVRHHLTHIPLVWLNMLWAESGRLLRPSHGRTACSLIFKQQSLVLGAQTCGMAQQQICP